MDALLGGALVMKAACLRERRGAGGLGPSSTQSINRHGPSVSEPGAVVVSVLCGQQRLAVAAFTIAFALYGDGISPSPLLIHWMMSDLGLPPAI